MKLPRPPGGRPKRKLKPGERVPLSLRVTPDVKAQLEKAASKSGRSQSQEAEFRLEQTFRDEGVIQQVTALKFGRPLAGILLAVGEVMNAAGSQQAFEAVGSLDAATNWINNPHGRNEAVSAAMTILERLRPEDDFRSPASGRATESPGQLFANTYIEAICAERTLRGIDDFVKIVREMLGDEVAIIKARIQ